MNSTKLKEAVNQIYVKEEVQEQMILNVKKQEARRRRRAKMQKKAGAFAACAALIMAAAIPIQAGIHYLVKDRMEHIPENELQNIRQMINDQDNVQADSYSREYTKEERNRMERLKEAYENGTFPEQTILLADAGGQIPEASLWYDTKSGTFHLPERALTDEELLQIIDFQYTSSYALEQGEAAQKSKKEWEQKEERLKEAVQKEGGITQEEAVKIAETYLESEFHCSADGMDVYCFLDELEEKKVYHVSFSTEDEHNYVSYGIDLDAADGELLDTSSASLAKRGE